MSDNYTIIPLKIFDVIKNVIFEGYINNNSKYHGYCKKYVYKKDITSYEGIYDNGSLKECVIKDK
jgi:hypothetical protein